MRLMVAPYNNGALTWTETEETAFRSYQLDHSFNKPAECRIVLDDPDGTILQKYNADANDVYPGVGKITLEDPTATDIFYGRMMKAVGDSAERTVVLECRDWLDQLDEENITYDMREKLSGNIRQSTVTSDHDNTDGTGIQPVRTTGAGGAYVYDGSGILTADAHNGQNLVLTTGMAGTRSWSMGPYTKTTTPATDTDSYDGVFGDLWVDDGLGHLIADNDADFTVDYEFRVYLGHNTPSDFYVDDSMTGARLTFTYFLTVSGVEGAVYMRDAGNTQWYNLGTLEVTDDAVYKQVTFEIPAHVAADMVNSSGIVKVRFDIDYNTVAADLSIRYLWLEVDCVTTGHSTAAPIIDGETYRLTTSSPDFSTATYHLWDGVPYCVAKKIYKHIESATGPVLGGGDIVTLTCGDANVEDTSGVSTRQYKDRTRLQILQDLASQDKSVFWITLGGVTVTYKQTFGASTATLTDAVIDSWQSLYDYTTMTNSYDVYGARIGDYEIYQQSQNAASILKYLATRSKVEKDSGLVSDTDAKAIGTALVARDCELSQMVGCTLSGLDTTHRLGTIVEITSSYLWPTAAKDYIVNRWAYDSKEHKTYLTLHPKVSIGLQEIVTPYTEGPTMRQGLRRVRTDQYVPDPVTHEVA